MWIEVVHICFGFIVMVHHFQSIEIIFMHEMNAHRWELLGVVRVDIILAADCHRQGDVSAVGQHHKQERGSGK